MWVSKLQRSPKSKLIAEGYINIYSKLNVREKKQVLFKEKYKLYTDSLIRKNKKSAEWDESMVYLANMFSKYVSKDSVVLDAGCGHGSYIIDENRRAIKWAEGIDVSKPATKNNICLDEIIIGDLCDMPFDSDTFDAVTSLWVLEHIENPDKMFEQVYRVLKKDGIFLFATPYKWFLPLVVVRILQNTRINYFINKFLFGRKREDIFKAYYKANTISKLELVSQNKFDIIELRLNFDPSYTSFNNFSFWLTVFIYSLFEKVGLKFMNAHIIGVFRKK